MEITDPNIISKLAAQFTEQPAQEPEVTIMPPNPVVELPGGLVKNGKVINRVTVGELTGADEEAIAAASSTGAAMSVILTRGLKYVDGMPPVQEDFEQLLLGDIEAILMGIYVNTFGEGVTYSYTCTSCGHQGSGQVDLTKDVQVRTLASPLHDASFLVNLSSGKIAEVALPNGITQKRLQSLTSATDAEITTAILSGCLISINGMPSMGASTAKSLGIKDRAEIMDEIISRNPGPVLGGVKKACEECGNTHSVPLSLAALFRL